MKPLGSALLATAAVFVPACASFAQSTAVTPALGATVAEIYDSRSTTPTGAALRLVLTLTGDPVVDAHSVHRVRITAARDDRGRDLAMPQPDVRDLGLPLPTPASVVPPSTNADEQRRLEAVAAEVARRRNLRESAGIVAGALPPIPTTTSFGSGPNPTRTLLTLRSPSRQASTVELIEGEIELFAPTADNGGLVTVRDFTAEPGKPQQPASLQKHDVQIVYLTAASFGQHAGLFGPAAKPTLEGVLRLYGPDAVFVAVRDPKRAVADFELHDADGKRLNANPSFGGSVEWNRMVFHKGPFPDGTVLRLRLRTPAALKTYSFKVENVPLP